MLDLGQIKNGPSKICRRQPLNNFTWAILIFFWTFTFSNRQHKRYFVIATTGDSMIQDQSFSERLYFSSNILSSFCELSSLKRNIQYSIFWRSWANAIKTKILVPFESTMQFVYLSWTCKTSFLTVSSSFQVSR